MPQPQQVPALAQGVGEGEHRLLPALHQIRRVVQEDDPTTMGISECASWPGSERRCSRSSPPVARAASEKVVATTAMKTSIPMVRNADSETDTGTA